MKRLFVLLLVGVCLMVVERAARAEDSCGECGVVNGTNFGPCPTGQFCGNGFDSCVSPPQVRPNFCCTPSTCAHPPVGAAYACGSFFDTCTNMTVECGTCPSGQECKSDNSSCCTPKTCAQQNTQCGEILDGCGFPLQCGSCASGSVCVNGQCCTPSTCAQHPGQCGSIPDGCGGTLNCGTINCSVGQECNGSGTCCTPNVSSCGAHGCGVYSDDGCGHTLNCGSCPNGDACGSNHQCCQPTVTCAGRICGFLADGCGGTLNCGGCSTPGTECNATGTACIAHTPATPLGSTMVLGLLLLSAGLVLAKRTVRHRGAA